MKIFTRIAIVAGVLVLTCIGGLAFIAIRIGSAKANPTHDYAGEIEALAAAAQGPRSSQPDRWSDLTQLIEQAEKINHAVAVKHKLLPRELPSVDVTILLPAVKQEAPEPEKLLAAKDYLAALEQDHAYTDLARLVRSGRYVRPLPKGQWLIEVMLPELGKARGLARATKARMYLAWQNKDFEAYIESVEGGLGMAQIFCHQGILIDRLVGSAMMTMILEEISDDLTPEAAPPEVLSALAKLVDTYTVIPPATLSLEAERRAIKDTIQWTFSDDGDGGGFLLPGSLRKLQTMNGLSGPSTPAVNLLGNFAGVVFATRSETTAKADEYFDKTVAYSALTRQRRTTAPFQPDLEVERLGKRYTLLHVLLPAMGRAIANADNLELQIRGTRILLAIERSRAAHQGQLPPSLEALVPEFLSAVPLDPVACRGFAFKPQDPAKDPRQRSFLLYSLGADAKDDGGRENPQPGVRVQALSSNGAGSDYVINSSDVKR